MSLFNWLTLGRDEFSDVRASVRSLGSVKLARELRSGTCIPYQY